MFNKRLERFQEPSQDQIRNYYSLSKCFREPFTTINQEREANLDTSQLMIRASPIDLREHQRRKEINLISKSVDDIYSQVIEKNQFSGREDYWLEEPWIKRTEKRVKRVQEMAKKRAEWKELYSRNRQSIEENVVLQQEHKRIKEAKVSESSRAQQKRNILIKNKDMPRKDLGIPRLRPSNTLEARKESPRKDITKRLSGVSNSPPKHSIPNIANDSAAFCSWTVPSLDENMDEVLDF